MSLADLLPLERVVHRLRAASKAALLAELGRRAAANLGLDPVMLAGLLAAREGLGSTGFGGGVAVPHARVDGVTLPAGFLARLDRPLDYAAIDGRPVDLVFLLVSPKASNEAHLAALAAASRRLRDPAVVRALRAAGDAAELRKAFVEAVDNSGDH
jgi:PTS system nitrogen regulatory IIA component